MSPTDADYLAAYAERESLGEKVGRLAEELRVAQRRLALANEVSQVVDGVPIHIVNGVRGYPASVSRCGDAPGGRRGLYVQMRSGAFQVWFRLGTEEVARFDYPSRFQAHDAAVQWVVRGLLPS